MNSTAFNTVSKFISTYRWGLHIFFWFSIILAFVIEQPYLVTKLGKGYFLLFISARFLSIALVVYLNLYVLLPYFNKSKKTLNYIGLISGLILVVAFLQVKMETFIYDQVFRDESYDFYDFLYFFASMIICNLWHVGSTTALKFAKQYFLQESRVKQIEIEKLQTEVKYLMAQINPHFLFNALNAVYVQIDKSNKEARETLSKFSDILRYQLYECNADWVHLRDEITFLQNYVDIQRLRKSERYDIRFTTDTPLENTLIPSMLLIGFVENAFKHLSSSKDKVNFVDIKLRFRHNTLEFEVENSKDTVETHATHEGIGLKNIQRRLALLFPNQYTLNINDAPSTFVVQLKLHLP